MTSTSQLPIAIQLYTLREACAKDFQSTLQAVAEMGYRGVEFAGLHGHDPKEVRQWLAEFDLFAVGGHVGWELLRDDFANQIEIWHRVLGCCHLIVGSGPYDFDKVPTLWENFATTMIELSRKCREAGVELSYHNHDFEYRPFGHSSNALVYLLENPEAVNAGLNAEIDLYWVAFANEDPAAELRRFAGRMPLIHVKDMSKDAERQDCIMGQGRLDWNQLIPIAKECGVKWLIVEQDHPASPAIESVQKSLQYLQTLPR